jgi:hypothetical protein
MRKTALVLMMAVVLAVSACGGKPKVRPEWERDQTLDDLLVSLGER